MACNSDGKACMVRLAGPVAAATPQIQFHNITSEIDAWGKEPACTSCGNATFVLSTPVVSARRFGNGAPAAVLAAMPNPLLPLTLRAIPYVKLRVSSSQWRGPIWIDTGRGIVVPSPHACLGIVGPAGFRVVNEGDVISPLTPGSDYTLWEAWLQIKTCCACCSNAEGDPILTDSQQVPANTDVVFVVPPGAREATLTCLSSANGTLTGRWMVGNAPDFLEIGNFAFGSAAFANFRHECICVVPNATRLIIRSTVANPFTIAWRVQP